MLSVPHKYIGSYILGMIFALIVLNVLSIREAASTALAIQCWLWFEMFRYERTDQGSEMYVTGTMFWRCVQRGIVLVILLALFIR